MAHPTFAYGLIPNHFRDTTSPEQKFNSKSDDYIDSLVDSMIRGRDVEKISKADGSKPCIVPIPIPIPIPIPVTENFILRNFSKFNE